MSSWIFLRLLYFAAMRAALLIIIICFCRIAYGQQNTPYVILVSFDGFRHDYVDLFNAIHFKAFIKKGAQASLIPSFPSKTFPNHYTLVTGLYPGNHGLVDNSFYDPTRKVFYSMGNKARVRDPYFYGGKPLWQLARAHKIKSASYFWVGTEVPGDAPDYVIPYNETIADSARVDQVLAWLALPSADRPHFITLYFSSPDTEGHDFGPESNETRQAVMHADSILARLMKGVEKVRLPVNVLLVSDHGMRGLKQEESSYIFLEEVMNTRDSSVRISNGGTQVHIYLKTERQDSLFALLRSKSLHFDVMTEDQFPARWHYQSQRSGDILLTAHDGYYFRDRSRKSYREANKKSSTFGVHGYDPSIVAEMKGIFYASGPNILPGARIDSFENIHVYPFIARILGLTIPKVDGSVDVLQKFYRPAKKQ
ncbi:MAG: ectonucleotide pyrophosphatase/phosphodiesterase [Chryseolinea sp.]